MKKALPLFAALALSLGACSVSNQVAQYKDYNDDVYYSDISATVMTVAAKSEKPTVSQNEQYGYRQQTLRGEIYDYYPGGIYYQIAPWRNPYYHSYNHFYDPYLDYYGYNNWYSPGVSIYIYPYRNLYGYPYLGSTYWGPVSYNNYYPGYSYPSIRYAPTINDPNYRARPSRGYENIGGLVNPAGTIRTDANGNILTTPSRGEIYERNGRSTSSTTSRPAPDPNTGRARPSRTSTTNPDNTRTIIDASPRVYEPQPVMSQPSSGNSNSGGSSSSSDDGSRARPARVGN